MKDAKVSDDNKVLCAKHSITKGSYIANQILQSEQVFHNCVHMINCLSDPLTSKEGGLAALAA